MAVFQHVLWGFELTYPEDWFHRNLGDVEAFAMLPEALNPDYDGPKSGQVLVRCEWNALGQPIQPIWNRHIGLLSGWMGAKTVGSAPWHMGGATGIEAEIVLPRKDEKRLWTGVLERDRIVLHFVVIHLKQEFEIYQSGATAIISSLRFPRKIEGVLNTEDLPLPPGYRPVPAQDLVDDIRDPQKWLAFDGEQGIGALQAFFLREAPNFGWKILEYVPFTGSDEMGFARLRLERKGRQVTLGILPYPGEDRAVSQPARLVFKFE